MALLGNVSLAARVAAFTGDFESIFVRFAMGTAIFLAGHTGA